MKKNILVTGCSSGIGLCAAAELNKQGYNVIATVRTEADKQNLEEQGITSTLLDLNSSESIQAAVKFTINHFNNNVDALFNNAAYGQAGAIEDLKRDVLRQQFETNVFGTQELTNHIIAQMRKQGHGRIIYNSSVLGIIGMAYRGAYTASKHAIEGIADTLRQELDGTGIYISLIEPGPIMSKFRANAFESYKKSIDKENSPHRATYEIMERRLTKKGPTTSLTLPPEAVVKKLLHALESKRPKVRYYVTSITYVFATMKRVLPHSWLDWALIKISKRENKE